MDNKYEILTILLDIIIFIFGNTLGKFKKFEYNRDFIKIDITKADFEKNKLGNTFNKLKKITTLSI